MSPPPTRTISWQQLVLEADPHWAQDARRPWTSEFSNGRRFYAPASLYAPLPPSGLTNDGGYLGLTVAAGYPTSINHLDPGAVWNDGGFGGVVPGAVPPPNPPALFFPGITADQLLLFGGKSLPPTQPPAGTNQLWINGGFVCVA